MGKRARQRSRTGGALEPVRDHMARVRVSDDAWADFRAAAGSRSMAAVLAELVEGEVRRYRRERLAAGHTSDRELLAALVETRELRADLDAIVGRLERRLDRPSPEPPGVYR